MRRREKQKHDTSWWHWDGKQWQPPASWQFDGRRWHPPCPPRQFDVAFLCDDDDVRVGAVG